MIVRHKFITKTVPFVPPVETLEPLFLWIICYSLFKLILIFCLLGLVSLVESIDYSKLSNLEQSNLTVRNVFNKIHQFNQELINDLVSSIDLNPNSLLKVLLPEAERIVDAEIEYIRRCYDLSLNGEEVNIFTTPIGVIIKKFFVSINCYQIQIF